MFYHDVQKPRILFENHLTNNTASDLVPTLIDTIRITTSYPLSLLYYVRTLVLYTLV